MIFIDNTTAGDLACSTKAWLRHVKQRVMADSVNEPMLVGQAMHEMLAAYLTGSTVGETLQVLRSAYNEKISWVPESERLQGQMVEQIARYWLLAHPRPQFPEVLMTEQVFETALTEDITFWGIIDAIVRYPDGSVYIMEHKTTSTIDSLWERQWNFSSQLIGYQVAARQLWPQLNIAGVVVNAIAMTKLPPYDGNLQKKCQKHKVKYEECQSLHMQSKIVGPFSYSEKQIEQWRHTMIEKARQLRVLQYMHNDLNVQHIPMEGLFTFDMSSRGNMCNSCMYKQFCMTGRPPEAIERVMQHETWTLETARL